AALGWVTAATGAIEVARALLTKVASWLDLYRETPGIPVPVLSAVDKMLSNAFETLERADALVKKGGETQAEAERVYASARQMIDDILALLAEVGLFSRESLKLVEPPGAPKRLRADGSAEPGNETAVQLPPVRLSE